MNRKLVRLLASVCIGLALVIAAEWLYAGYSRRQLLAEIRAAQTQAYQANVMPHIELAQQPEQRYADLVARPLFIKGRRPAKEPVPEVAVQGLGTQSENFDWQLSGVYSTRDKMSALLSRVKTKVAKDNYRKTTMGDQVDGWKIAEINKDRVIVTQGLREKELLLHAPKAKEPAPPHPQLQPPQLQPQTQQVPPFPTPPPQHSPFSPLTPVPEPPPPDAPAPAPTEDSSETNQ